MPSRADLKRWLEGFAAAEAADRQVRRREGPRLERSVALSLSLLRAAGLAAGGPPRLDPRRAEREEAVRAAWQRLRARLVR